MLVDASSLIGTALEWVVQDFPTEDPTVNATVDWLTACQYIGLIAFAGLVVFERWIVPAGQRSKLFMRVVPCVFLLAGTAATLLLVPLTALRIAGRPFSAAWDTSEWGAYLYPPSVQAALVLLVAAPTALLIVRAAEPAAWSRFVFPLVVLACLGIPVLSGHTRSQQPAWLIFAADLTHLAVAAVWLGGLLGLLLRLGRLPATPPEAFKLAAVVVRFSGFALVSVVLLAVSGVVMAFLILDGPAQLLSGSYGRMLLVKVGLVFAAVAVALWNRMGLIRHLATSSGSEWSSLRRTLAYELLLLVVVAVITAVLTGTSPSHSH